MYHNTIHVEKPDIRLTGPPLFLNAASDGWPGPRTLRLQETVEIAASTVPAFKPGKPLKDAVNGAG